MQTAKEYWVSWFRKEPKTDKEKLQVAMIADYAEKCCEALAEQFKPKWISDDPKKQGEYLVLHNNGDIGKGHWIMPKNFPDYAYPYWSGDKNTITHWMPLPEKPEGK